jgi:DNA processing protein
MKEDKYWVGLSMIKGLGPINIRNLLDYFKTPRSIWFAARKELKMVKNIGQVRAETIVKVRNNINLTQEMEKLRENNIKYVLLKNKDYPQMLKNIYDPPPILYYKGKDIFQETSLALIGSRRSTSYGRKTAKKISYKLSQKGFVVVSGMARGIDSYGHRGALQASGRTIAVLGSGFNYIYPPENRKLCEQIQDEGAVISEFAPDTKPVAGNFPRRNRIISGLSRGVIVVEAAQRSGSLITANQALEQGREVFAVPGNIDRTQSQGTNNLIREGAKIVTKVEDVLEELFLYQEVENDKMRSLYPELNKSEEKIVNIFKHEPELSIDQIVSLCEFKVSRVNRILLKLELKGIVEQQPGKKYVFKGLQNLLKPI